MLVCVCVLCQYAYDRRTYVGTYAHSAADTAVQFSFRRSSCRAPRVFFFRRSAVFDTAGLRALRRRDPRTLSPAVRPVCLSVRDRDRLRKGALFRVVSPVHRHQFAWRVNVFLFSS